MVKIIRQPVNHLPIIPWALGKPTCIVAHEVANDKSTVAGERNYMSNNYNNAFYHAIAGEDGFYIFHDPSKGGAWGAGPSMHKYAIHVELIRSSTKAGFNKAYKNYVEGIQYFAKKYGISLKLNTGSNKRGIYTHDYVRRTFGGTTHTDPNAYFAKYGKTITQFGKDLKGTVSSVASEWKKVTGNWTGQTLGEWEYGKPVRQLQTMLYEAYPRYLKKSDIDDYFGTVTKKAVRKYQKDMGLTVDSLAGKQVYKSLKEGLTMEHYKDLNNRLKKVEKSIKNKVSKPSDKGPSSDHEKGWNFLLNRGISKGGNPLHYLNREQGSTLLLRFYETFLQMPSWMYEDIANSFDGMNDYLHRPEEWKERIKNKDAELAEILGMFILAFLRKENEKSKDKAEEEKEK